MYLFSSKCFWALMNDSNNKSRGNLINGKSMGSSTYRLVVRVILYIKAKNNCRMVFNVAEYGNSINTIHGNLENTSLEPSGCSSDIIRESVLISLVRSVK